MTLYSLAGGYPAPLSFDDMEDAGGRLWKNLADNPDGLEACGYAVAPEPPAYDAATQVLGWADGAWSVVGLSLDTLKAAASARAAAEFGARISTGYAHDGHPVQLDDGSQARLTAVGTTAIAASSGAIPWPTGYAKGWIAADGVRIPLPTAADGLQFSAAVGAYYAALVQHEQDLIDAIAAAASAEDLAAIDVSAGWP